MEQARPKRRIPPTLSEMAAVITTSSLSPFGQLEFELSYDESCVSDQDVQWFAEQLKSIAEKGGRIRAGETVQIGSTLCLASANGSNLVLQEPDYRSFPIVWQSEVTRTIMMLKQQFYVAQSFARVSVLETSLLQSAALCQNLDAHSGMVIERLAPSSAGSDSGWSICCAVQGHAHDTPDNLRRASVYEALTLAPAVAPYLSLGPGFALQQSPAGPPGFFWAGRSIRPKVGSYAEELVSLTKARGHFA